MYFVVSNYKKKTIGLPEMSPMYMMWRSSDLRTTLQREQHIVANPVQAKNEGTFNAFRGETSGDRIDYIFCSPDVDVRRCIIVHDNDAGQYPSDHFPILADLQRTKP